MNKYKALFILIVGNVGVGLSCFFIPFYLGLSLGVSLIYSLGMLFVWGIFTGTTFEKEVIR